MKLQGGYADVRADVDHDLRWCSRPVVATAEDLVNRNGVVGAEKSYSLRPEGGPEANNARVAAAK